MAGFFQQFLKGAGDGFIDSPNLRDYQHASKIFRNNAYGNSPKFKWLFHVYFDINKQAVAGPNTSMEQLFPSTTNYGILVKSIDLPKFQISLQEMNQYNRKRLVQTKISYDPIRIVFHDDNANQIRQLWYNYFSYHYNDPNQPYLETNSRGRTIPGQSASELNFRKTYTSNTPEFQNNQYWGLNGRIFQADEERSPFFKSIRIYGFNQHNWALYELINPMIETFGHDNYSYYDTRGIMENNMTIKYELVKYYDGALDGQDPSSIVTGFAEPRQYDTTLSPINLPGTNKTVLGQGGLLDAGKGIINDLANQNYLSALQTALRTGRTFKNTRSVIEAGKADVIQKAYDAAPGATRAIFNFPAAGVSGGKNSQQINSTNAKSTTPAPVETRNPPSRG